MRKFNSPKALKLLFPYITILIFIFLILNYQILKQATVLTSDAYVHFYRFYDTSMQLKTGNFSYFQTNYGFNHSGRIFNALYGPLFAYLNALFLLVCHNWFIYQLLSEFIVFLIGGIGMYKLGLKVKTNYIVSLILSLIYLEVSLINGITRFNFMAWGAALAPYVIMQAVNMVQDHKKPIHWATLALIMSLLGQIHLLSTLILSITLVPFALYSLITTENKKEMLLDLAKAIGVTLILTANIWGALLMLYHTNKISPPFAFNMTNYMAHYSHYYNMHGYVMLSIIIALILQIIYIICHFKDLRLNTLATIVAVILFLLASKIVPWNMIQIQFPALKSSFQFPYRLLIGAWPLVLMTFGLTITQIAQHSKIVNAYLLMGIILILLQNFAPRISANKHYTNNYLYTKSVILATDTYHVAKDRTKIQTALRRTNDGTLFKTVTRTQRDYLPYKNKKPTSEMANNLYKKYILKVEHNYNYKVNKNNLQITWNARKNTKRVLPVVMYHQSQLILNGKVVHPVGKTKIMQPIIKEKHGKNIAILSFKTSIYFIVLLWLTILAWIGVAGYLFKLLVKKYITK